MVRFEDVNGQAAWIDPDAVDAVRRSAAENGVTLIYQEGLPSDPIRVTMSPDDVVAALRAAE